MDKWDQNFFEMCKIYANFSKDPSRKIGAVAVNPKNRVVLSAGYNGFPRNVVDSEDRLNTREIKLQLVVHAEMNCIYNACLNGVSLNESTLYVYGLPVCVECSKGVIQVGIKRVVIYTPERSKSVEDIWSESFRSTQVLFDESGIDYVWYDSESIDSRS